MQALRGDPPWLAALLVILLGCTPAVPARVDPFTGLFFAHPRAEEPVPASIRNQGLALATVISENSKHTFHYLDDAKLTAVEVGLVGQVATRLPADNSRVVTDLDASPLIARSNAQLERSFSRLVPVGSPIEAAEVGADLIGVLDLYVDLGSVSFQTTTVELGVIFTTLDGRPIESVRGLGKAKVPFPATNFAFGKASDRAIESLATALERLP